MRRTRTARRDRRGRRAEAAPGRRSARRDVDIAQQYEVEVVSGLEEYSRRELRRRLGKAAQLGDGAGDGRISLRYGGDIRRFDELRTVVAVHRVEGFQAPRPRALLGHENLTRLVAAIRSVLDVRSAGSYRTFRIAAAGSGSVAFRRLRDEIAAATGLEPSEDAAHLQVAVRRGGDVEGWEALIRTSPMPHSARRWRVCDMPGALNATVASVMASMAGVRPNDRALNMCCGSGTLLVERLGLGRAAGVVGADMSVSALGCADENLRAAGHRSSVSLVRADCGRMPLPDGWADTITADLPYGMLLNGSGDIASLYLSVVGEAARVGTSDASLVVVTTQRRALLSAVERVGVWRIHNEVAIRIPHKGGYIAPQIYLLRRGKGARGRI